MQTCQMKCNKTQWTVPCRPWKSTTSRRILLHLSRRLGVQSMNNGNVSAEAFLLLIYLFLQEFDKKYNPTWHCIVGRNFGSYVTHETKHFIYFYLGQVAILLFKSGWNVHLCHICKFDTAFLQTCLPPGSLLTSVTLCHLQHFHRWTVL